MIAVGGCKLRVPFARPFCTRARPRSALPPQCTAVHPCALGILADAAGRHALQGRAHGTSGRHGRGLGGAALRGFGARPGAAQGLAGLRRAGLRPASGGPRAERGAGVGARAERGAGGGSPRRARACRREGRTPSPRTGPCAVLAGARPRSAGPRSAGAVQCGTHAVRELGVHAPRRAGKAAQRGASGREGPVCGLQECTGPEGKGPGSDASPCESGGACEDPKAGSSGHEGPACGLRECTGPEGKRPGSEASPCERGAARARLPRAEDRTGRGRARQARGCGPFESKPSPSGCSQSGARAARILAMSQARECKPLPCASGAGAEPCNRR